MCSSEKNWDIRSVVEGYTWLHYIPHSWWIIRSFLSNLMLISTQTGLYVPTRSSLWSPILSLVFCVYPSALLWWRSCVLVLGILVPLWRGIHHFWRGWSAMASNVLGIPISTFWFFFPFTKKVSWGILLFSLTRFLFCCHISSYYVEKNRLR